MAEKEEAMDKDLADEILEEEAENEAEKQLEEEEQQEPEEETAEAEETAKKSFFKKKEKPDGTLCPVSPVRRRGHSRNAHPPFFPRALQTVLF